jgi:hypothetical protein
VQKTDHSQFTAFVLGEIEDLEKNQNPTKKIQLLWIGSLLVSVLGILIGIFNNGDLDRRISAYFYQIYQSSTILGRIGSVLQYSYFVFLAGGLICLILVIVSFVPKKRDKINISSRYASLYLLVMGISFFIHLILQLVVNRLAPSFIYDNIDPFYMVHPSIFGLWNSSFPNNNLVLSGVVILLPVLFGKQSAVFKWIMGIISGAFISLISIVELGLSHAWITDIFASIGIVILVSWLIYWNVLFIKERERTELFHKLNEIFYQAYDKLIESKKALESNRYEDCKRLLNKAKELFNQSINSIQNYSGDNSRYLYRNEFWKFNISLLLQEIENGSSVSRKWMYIF